MFLHLSVSHSFHSGGGVHPLGRHPQADTPRADTPTRQTPPGQTSPRQTSPKADNPLPETATLADGTHPTGMHSCLCRNRLCHPRLGTTLSKKFCICHCCFRKSRTILTQFVHNITFQRIAYTIKLGNSIELAVHRLQ